MSVSEAQGLLEKVTFADYRPLSEPAKVFSHGENDGPRRDLPTETFGAQFYGRKLLF
jgi:hypothetical protein